MTIVRDNIWEVTDKLSCTVPSPFEDIKKMKAITTSGCSMTTLTRGYVDILLGNPKEEGREGRTLVCGGSVRIEDSYQAFGVRMLS